MNVTGEFQPNLFREVESEHPGIVICGRLKVYEYQGKG